jgi:aspartyl protease family protein
VNDNARMIYALLCLILVGSALMARRLPMGHTLKYALGWVAIFGIGLTLASFRHEGAALWHRVIASVSPETPTIVGKAVLVGKGEDGHFHVAGQVNGHNVTFLIDTGATTSTLSGSTAKAAGVDVEEGGFPVIVDTANGTAAMHRARAELTVGNIRRADLPFLVSEDVEDLNLLGMNFLSTLKSWRVEGNDMVFEP